MQSIQFVANTRWDRDSGSERGVVEMHVGSDVSEVYRCSVSDYEQERAEERAYEEFADKLARFLGSEVE